MVLKHIVAGTLDVAYREIGTGAPVILLHGFPYDIHAYDAVAERLAASGRRCIVPYLRGYGETRFLSADTAALGAAGGARAGSAGSDGRAGAAAGGARRL